MFFETILMVAGGLICFIFGRITAPKDQVDYDDGYSEGWSNAFELIGKRED